MPESDVVSRLLAAIDERAKEALSISAGRFVEGLAGRQVDPDLNRYLDTVADPDAVLRLCQSHRDIVALHAEVPVAPGRSETTCVECGSVKGWPCPTLVLVARGYGVEDGED